MDNPETKETEKQRFIVDNEQSLKWVLQLMESKRKQIGANLAMEQEAFDFYEGKNDALRKEIAGWQEAVKQYANDQLKDDPDWKFTESPYGRVVKQKAKQRIVADNRDALIKQFKSQEFVKVETQYKLDWKLLSKHLSSDDSGHVFTDDGEIVSGAKVKKTPAQIVIKHKNAKGNWTSKEEKKTIVIRKGDKS